MDREVLFRALATLGVRHGLHQYKRWTGRATVLALHRVSDERDIAWPPMRVRVFEQLMNYLAQHYEVVSLQRLREGNARGRRPALVLTFDDGYADFRDHALPVLRRLGLPAVHNVVVECVETGAPIWTQRLNHLCSTLQQRGQRTTISLLGKSYDIPAPGGVVWLAARLCVSLLGVSREERLRFLRDLEHRSEVPPAPVRMMGWDDLRQCQRDGIEIGSHSMTHDVLSNLGVEALRFEVYRSRELLRERLGTTVETFAFPNSVYDSAALFACRDAGYRNLLTIDEGFYRPGEADDDLIPRVLIAHDGVQENVLNVEGLHPLVRRAKRLLAPSQASRK